MDKKKSMKPKKADKTVPDSLLDWGKAIMAMPRLKHWMEGYNLKCSCGLEIPLSKHSNIVKGCACGKMYYLQFDGIVSELVKTTAKLVKKSFELK
jgi:hypothetical protein